MTEQRRDLAADLRFCHDFLAGSGESDTERVGNFVAVALEGWPHAIRRAMEAEAEVKRLRAALSRCGDLADQGYAIGGAVAKENCEQIGMITLQELNGRILGKVGGGCDHD